jgi:hypothetical protein
MKPQFKFCAVALLAASLWQNLSIHAHASDGIHHSIPDKPEKMAMAPTATFSVLSPTASTVVAEGTSLNVTWDVAGTNVAPIAAANVSILLRVDAFPQGYALVLNTPNDGTQSVTIPVGAKSNGATITVTGNGTGGIVSAQSAAFTISGTLCFPLGSCQSGFGNGPVQSFQITNSTGSTVLMSNLNTGCGIQPGNTGYSNYAPNPALRPSLARGTTYRLVSSTCTGSLCQTGFGYYIDLNRDGLFNGTNEYLGGTDPATGSIAFNWTVPTTYTEGYYRLRVKGESTRKPLAGEACGGFTFAGEAEDYLVFVSSYCAPSFTNGCNLSFINGVSLATFSNSNTGCSNQGLTGNYSLFTGPGLLDNQTYPFSVSVGGAIGGAYVAIYGDFNNDGDFSDGGEILYQSINAALIHSGTFSIPAGISGTRRIRIRSSAQESLNLDGACATRNVGETEDYNVLIGSGVMAAGDQTVCNGGDPANITLSTAPATGATFQWYRQTGLVSAPATTDPITGWTAISGATTSSHNPPVGLTASTTYACRITLGGTSRWATGVRRVTVLPAVNFGTLASGNQTFSETGDPSIIGFGTAPSGGNGTFTYRWYRANGLVAAPTGTTVPSNWTLISGATSNTYDPPAVFYNTSYAVMVDPTGTQNCGGFTWASGVRQITITNGCLSYCQPDRGTIAPNSSLFINSVSLAGVTTTSGFNNHYARFPLTNFLNKGTTINFTINATSTFTSNRYYALFADWNKDGDFTDGLSELLYLSGAVAGNSASGSFTVPASALGGRTTLRAYVIAGYDPLSNPCPSLANDLWVGEVEDYCVYVSNNLNPGTVASGNQNLCNGSIPGPVSITGFAPATGASFQWYSREGIVSAPPASSGTEGWTLISGATNTTLTPTTPLTSSISYACRVSANGSSLWAASVRQVTIRAVVNFGTLAQGDQAFPSGSGDPAPISFSTLPSGGSGSFTYQWYSASINQPAPSGTTVPTGWTAINGATSSTYDPSVLTTGTAFAVMVNPAGSPDCGVATWASGVRRISMFSFFPGAFTSVSVPICFGGDPDVISVTTPPTAGSTYQWYFQPAIVPIPEPAANAPLTGWSVVNGATSSSFDPPAGETISKTYVCRVTNGTNSLWANGLRQVPVAPAFNPGTLTAGNQTFTASGDPSEISFAVAPSGGNFGDFTSGYTYRWYSASGIQPAPTGTTVPANWTLIETATGSTFNPPVLTSSTSFAVMVDPFGDFDCGSSTWAGGVRQITINPATPFSPGVVAPTSQTICYLGNPGPLSFSVLPTSGSSFQWYSRNGLISAPQPNDPITGWSIMLSATGSTFDPDYNAGENVTFACRVTNGANSQWASGVVQVTVLPPFSPGSLIGDQSGCAGYNPAPITMATNPSGSGSYNWRWFYRDNNTTVACPTGSADPAGWITSSTDNRFFGNSTSGTGINFDPTSAGTSGRTWVLKITPASNGAVPACGTPSFTTCHRTLITPCRLDVEPEIADGLQLGQNIPNPYSDETRITCVVPEGNGKARLEVFSLEGKVLLTEALPEGGSSVVTIRKGQLAPGTYLYRIRTAANATTPMKMVVQ